MIMARSGLETMKVQYRQRRTGRMSVLVKRKHGDDIKLITVYASPKASKWSARAHEEMLSVTLYSMYCIYENNNLK